jgi:endonuclease YncB( thermonuclease family)
MLRRSIGLLAVVHVCAIVLASLGVVPAFSDPSPPATPPRAQQIVSPSDPARLRVYDGDTLHDAAAGVTYRVENIDTPETGTRAHCAAERAHGYRATRALRALVASADRLEIIPTGTDRYDRTIALVRIDGRDLGETLIDAGLARPWRGRREPWCDARGNLIR